MQRTKRKNAHRFCWHRFAGQTFFSVTVSTKPFVMCAMTIPKFGSWEIQEIKYEFTFFHFSVTRSVLYLDGTFFCYEISQWSEFQMDECHLGFCCREVMAIWRRFNDNTASIHQYRTNEMVTLDILSPSQHTHTHILTCIEIIVLYDYDINFVEMLATMRHALNNSLWCKCF